jgi:hypothetical protein
MTEESVMGIWKRCPWPCGPRRERLQRTVGTREPLLFVISQTRYGNNTRTR